MKTKKEMCQACNVNVATVKDHRDCDANGYGEGIGTFFVRDNCLKLSDHYFFELLKAQTDREKREILEKITETGNWKDYVIKNQSSGLRRHS